MTIKVLAIDETSDQDYEYFNSDTISTSAGSGDAGKLIETNSDGKVDITFIPDSVINDRDWKESVRFATTAALPAVTYANGTGGVGATLTADANGAFPTTDGVTPALNDELLVKNQVAGLQNGIYKITQLGDGSNPFILTRRTDADEDSENTAGQHVPIAEGTSNGDKFAYLTTNDPITVGTTALSYSLANLSSLTGGDGIDITANVISVDLVADGGLEFATSELQVKFADTTVANDLNGTNGLHAISAQDLSSNGASQGAKILGFDPSNCTIFTATNIQAAMDELCSAVESGVNVTFTVGAGGVTVGDLLYISANDTVLPYPNNTNDQVIGIAATTESAAASVELAPDQTVLAGVLTSLSPTAGDKVWWDGSDLTLTAPSAAGSRVWLAGIAKNANDLFVDTQFIKKNS